MLATVHKKLGTPKTLVDRYVPLMHQGSSDSKELHEELVRVYGEVAEVYREVVGEQRIEVPISGGRGRTSTFSNAFEAGFLSGRSFHTGQGQVELLKVIGQIKSRAEHPRLSGTANRFGNRVFIAHGHDEAVLQVCARSIEALGLSPVILREQPNRGRTIIEKFLDYADVGFAVVLLTGDDLGGAAGGSEPQRPRARQNVIFELGFLIGKLGRERVCALYEDGVDIPSDYPGVAFVALDPKGLWAIRACEGNESCGSTSGPQQAVSFPQSRGVHIEA